MKAITLLFKWQRNVWPIRNAGEPGTSFILARRNVCRLNFLHQSWVMGGDFPLVRGVCLHMQQSTIAEDKRNKLPARILCGRLVIYAAEDNISIVHAAFVGLYFIHEFLRASEPRLTLCVCTQKRRKLFHLATTVAGFQNTPDVSTV